MNRIRGWIDGLLGRVTPAVLVVSALGILIVIGIVLAGFGLQPFGVLDALIALSEGDRAATPIRSLPAATQDLSLVVSAEVPAGDVQAVVAEGAGELLEHIRLVDDYRGQGVEPGTKSLTFALRFRGADRTLTASQATEAKLAGLALAAERFGATLRE